MNIFGKIVVGFLVACMLACSYSALEFEESKDVIVTEKNKYILIEPEFSVFNTSFIFYPGGLVEPESYISLFQKLAEKGYPVIILKATSDLAIFNIDRASKVIDKFPDVQNWVIGGHSLGGVVATKAILKEPELYSGLVLFASFPADKDDLSGWDGAALSISAEHDLLSTSVDIDDTKNLMPEALVVDDLSEFPDSQTFNTTIYYEIEGGNHAQFGDYGLQKNDGVATITKDEQHELIIQLIESFLIINDWDY